jgi:hypothetical protein
LEHFASFGRGRCQVWADIVYAGKDLIVFIGGGERPHIGSMTISEGVGALFSFSVPNHKDYIVSSSAARRIGEKCGGRCLVISGIHIDGASKDEIDLLVANSSRCVDMIIGTLK